MAYVKQTWADTPSETTPISAARLAHMETQYDEALATLEDAVTSEDVQAIRVTQAPDELPSPGELLFRVQPPETFFYDFGSSALGPIPTGWGRKWNLSGTAEVTDGAGGRALSLSGASPAGTPAGFASEGMTQVLHGAVSGEVALKYRASGTSGRATIARLASGDTDRSFYYAGVRNLGGPGTRLEISKWVDGVQLSPFATNPDPALTVPAGVDYILVYRWSGIYHYAKFWAASDPEPSEWMAVGHDDLLFDGEWEGFSFINAGTNRLFWIGASRTEAPAPRGT